MIMAGGNITLVTQEYKLQLHQGTTFSFGVKPGYRDPDGTKHYYDLATHKLTWIVRDDRHEAQWDLSDRITVDGGIAYLDLDPVDMQRFKPHRRYYYNLLLTFPGGDIKLLMRGPIYVTAV